MCDLHRDCIAEHKYHRETNHGENISASYRCYYYYVHTSYAARWTYLSFNRHSKLIANILIRSFPSKNKTDYYYVGNTCVTQSIMSPLRKGCKKSPRHPRVFSLFWRRIAHPLLYVDYCALRGKPSALARNFLSQWLHSSFSSSDSVRGCSSLCQIK